MANENNPQYLTQLQKITTKNCKNQLHLAITNLTPIFKFNKQSKKRGKKKSMTFVPYFLPNNHLRIKFALKLFRSTLLKNKKGNKTFENFSKEILASSNSTKSTSVEQKNELQKQTFENLKFFFL